MWNRRVPTESYYHPSEKGVVNNFYHAIGDAGKGAIINLSRAINTCVADIRTKIDTRSLSELETVRGNCRANVDRYINEFLSIKFPLEPYTRSSNLVKIIPAAAPYNPYNSSTEEVTPPLSRWNRVKGMMGTAKTAVTSRLWGQGGKSKTAKKHRTRHKQTRRQ